MCLKYDYMIKIREATPADAPYIIDFQLKMALETEDLKLDEEILTKGVQAVFDDSSKGKYYIMEFDGKIGGNVER